MALEWFNSGCKKGVVKFVCGGFMAVLNVD